MTDPTGRIGGPGGPAEQGDTAVLHEATPSFAPSDLVPESGLPAWDEPDPARAPVARLDPQLPVQVTERRADGWTHIRCANDWTAWVDGRLLVPRDDLAADDELWSALHGALDAYGRLVDEFAAGTVDAPTFAKRALSIGLILREHDAWILDLPTQRWWRYDGISLTTVDLGELTRPGST